LTFHHCCRGCGHVVRNRNPPLSGCTRCPICAQFPPATGDGRCRPARPSAVMALRITLLDTRQHERPEFVCGIAALDDYLRQHAGQHQRDGIATIHVLIDDEDPARILGYRALSAAQLYLHKLSEADRK